jgi:hypothetical protein
METGWSPICLPQKPWPFYSTILLISAALTLLSPVKGFKALFKCRFGVSMSKVGLHQDCSWILHFQQSLTLGIKSLAAKS